MQYIHYGTTKFNPYFFAKIINIPYRAKPDGGFWASPVDKELFTWEKWCEVEGFCECNPEKSITFHLSENARVLYLTCKKDLDTVSAQYKLYDKRITILDFEALQKEYDAIEAYAGSNGYIGSHLYAWDCDSILIMNPKIIEFEQ